MGLTRRAFGLGGAASAAFAQGVAADTLRIISAQEASRAVEAGEMVLIDIRRPAEWKASGVASGAWPLDMTRREFGAQLKAAIEMSGERPVAMICATGGRTGHLQKILAENGWPPVIDVSEGMFGSAVGQGWLKEGLPVVSREDALEALPEALR